MNKYQWNFDNGITEIGNNFSEDYSFNYRPCHLRESKVVGGGVAHSMIAHLSYHNPYKFSGKTSVVLELGVQMCFIGNCKNYEERYKNKKSHSVVDSCLASCQCTTAFFHNGEYFITLFIVRVTFNFSGRYKMVCNISVQK